MNNRQIASLLGHTLPLLLCVSVYVGGVRSASAQIRIEPPFDSDYVVIDLGPVPGLPTRYGGLTFLVGDPETILIGGRANEASGQLHAIRVVRDALHHIIGFSGTATAFAAAANNDGGVAYGPGNVLFLARWPINQVGQTLPGSSITDKIVELGPLGVSSSPGGLAFVPPGYPGVGQLKIVGFSNGNWYTLDFTPDGTGTYDITSATLETTIAGGPEGFIYVPPGSPQFVDFNSMLVSEFSAGRVSTYALDGNGDPIPATRAPFITGLSGAEGAAIDPLTRDFLFSTFGGGDRVVAVRGFAPPPFEAEPVNPNTPIPCKGVRCSVRITCNLPPQQGIACRNRINLLLARAPRRSSRLSDSVGLDDERAVRAPFFRIASAVTNTPPGATRTVRLKLTSRGKGIVNTKTKKILRGFLEIRNTPGDLFDRTPVRIRIRR